MPSTTLQRKPSWKGHAHFSGQNNYLMAERIVSSVLAAGYIDKELIDRSGAALQLNDAFIRQQQLQQMRRRNAPPPPPPAPLDVVARIARASPLIPGGAFVALHGSLGRNTPTAIDLIFSHRNNFRKTHRQLQWPSHAANLCAGSTAVPFRQRTNDLRIAAFEWCPLTVLNTILTLMMLPPASTEVEAARRIEQSPLAHWEVGRLIGTYDRRVVLQRWRALPRGLDVAVAAAAGQAM